MSVLLIDTELGKTEKVFEILKDRYPEANIENCGKNGHEIKLDVFSLNPAVLRAEIEEIKEISHVLWQGA